MRKIFKLKEFQLAVINSPLENKIFLEGPAGSGKTSTAVERLIRMMADGIPGSSILILVPQRTLADPYYESLNDPGTIAGGMVDILTLGGLARRSIDLFWPVVAKQTGFRASHRMPTFLTLETAQYFMASLVAPLLDQGYFDSVKIDRNRIYSQIIDNLNKSALIGFPYTQIGERLKSAWQGEPSQLRVYQDVQECATAFRKYCLENNLLDFSLQIEIFWNQIWRSDAGRNYLIEKYNHLIMDNVEEDTPVAHDFVAEWLPDMQSALLIFDHDAGYRRFLGADPQSAYSLKARCDETRTFTETFVTSMEIQRLNRDLQTAIIQPGIPISTYLKKQTEIREQTESTDAGYSVPTLADQYSGALVRGYFRYYPEMLDWVADQIEGLISQDGWLPSDVVVLSPYVSDALRFSLIHRLERRNVPVRSHRPSRSLREEPATQCILTLCMLARPGWRYQPSRFDVAYAFTQAILGMDLVRAQLLTETVYQLQDATGFLISFAKINPIMQSRITYHFGDQYEKLRVWLLENTYPSNGEYEIPLDYFISRLFGEILSQPGFGFHVDYQKGEVVANLVESFKKFRWAIEPSKPEMNWSKVNQEYVKMVQEGVIAAQYIRSWQPSEEDAVLLSPAYTFLMSNRPVAVQFWLDVGNRGWYQRVSQPLTHPYVLSRHWEKGDLWTDADEVTVSQENLCCLVTGLLRRCRSTLYLGLSDLGEQGYEQRGALLHSFQRVLRGIDN